ncbi:hypothetical protein POTOM_033463 [Populus tomentosa]|uniref:SAUR-like auxin-responsive protein family n=1 Tax=Populus tomentosa TaxID=118781 RepID=A0A8X8CHL6_POPTO|nr:hypothetical protein POTOM_033463 [Populus tomentosa]
MCVSIRSPGIKWKKYRHPFLISINAATSFDPSSSQGASLTNSPLHYQNHFYSNHTFPDMGILSFPSVARNAKRILKHQSLLSRNHSNLPKGHVAVYVGECQKKRFVVPISYINHPSFLALLDRSEEEFGFNHPMGGLTIPCKEDAFIDLTSRLHDS